MVKGHHRHAPASVPIPAVDHMLGAVCTLCLLIGCPANIVSFLYFLKRESRGSLNRFYMAKLYRLISITDTLLCFLILPVILVSFSKHREPGIFASDVFCAAWGLLWNILPVLSVFLVAILSFSRTSLIVYPLKVLNFKTPLIFLTTSVFILATEKLVAAFSNYGTSYSYWKRHMVCYLQNVNDNIHYEADSYDFIQAIIILVVQALPIIPILASFSICVYKLQMARKKEMRMSMVKKKISKHRKAKVTVIIVTAVYILCNIPVLFSHFFFFSLFLQSLDQNGPGIPKELDRIEFSYVWVVAYAVLVVVNAACNPFVYFITMKEFKNYVSQGIETLKEIF